MRLFRPLLEPNSENCFLSISVGWFIRALAHMCKSVTKLTLNNVMVTENGRRNCQMVTLDKYVAPADRFLRISHQHIKISKHSF